MTIQIVIDVAGEVAGSPGASRVFDYSKIVTPAEVTLSLDDNTGITEYLWAIVSQPDGASAVLSSTTAAAPTFTPTAGLPGSYLVECTTNGDEDYARNGLAYQTEHLGLRKPAPTETTQFSSTRGWAGALASLIDEVDTLGGQSVDSGIRRRAVINVVDGALDPPTEVSGDRYIVTGTPAGTWDGATENDIVEFNGTVWEATTPSEGWVAYVDSLNIDYRYVDDGVGVWESVPGTSADSVSVDNSGWSGNLGSEVTVQAALDSLDDLAPLSLTIPDAGNGSPLTITQNDTTNDLPALVINNIANGPSIELGGNAWDRLINSDEYMRLTTVEEMYLTAGSNMYLESGGIASMLGDTALVGATGGFAPDLELLSYGNLRINADDYCSIWSKDIDVIGENIVVRPSVDVTGDFFRVSHDDVKNMVGSSGVGIWADIDADINQSGTAGYTVLRVNAKITNPGSGAKKLIDAQIDDVPKFTVADDGSIAVAGIATASAPAAYEGGLYYDNTTNEWKIGQGSTPAWIALGAGPTIYDDTTTFTDVAASGGTDTQELDLGAIDDGICEAVQLSITSGTSADTTIQLYNGDPSGGGSIIYEAPNLDLVTEALDDRNCWYADLPTTGELWVKVTNDGGSISSYSLRLRVKGDA